jgi:anthranilate phosphoribosyltransferase
LLDNCGTGGDQAGTFNVSTAAAIVVAACGVKVAKHGNRSFSSRAGSADVLQELGVNLDAPPERVAQCVEEVGIGFFFAPHWHPAVSKIQKVRRGLQFRTIFNLLGSLANPLQPQFKVIGVGGAGWQESLPLRMAEAIGRLGVAAATVVVGEDGLDEVTLAGRTRALRVTPAGIQEEFWSPEDFGLPRHTRAAWEINGVKDSADLIRRLFANEAGPAFDVVLANAAAALLTAGVARDLRTGAGMARDAVACGAAAAKLEALVRLTNA